MYHSVRAHSRHWSHGCIFWGLLYEKGAFYLFPPSSQIKFLTISNIKKFLFQNAGQWMVWDSCTQERHRAWTGCCLYQTMYSTVIFTKTNSLRVSDKSSKISKTVITIR